MCGECLAETLPCKCSVTEDGCPPRPATNDSDTDFSHQQQQPPSVFAYFMPDTTPRMGLLYFISPSQESGPMCRPGAASSGHQPASPSPGLCCMQSDHQRSTSAPQPRSSPQPPHQRPSLAGREAGGETRKKPPRMTRLHLDRLHPENGRNYVPLKPLACSEDGSTKVRVRVRGCYSFYPPKRL